MAQRTIERSTPDGCLRVPRALLVFSLAATLLLCAGPPILRAEAGEEAPVPLPMRAIADARDKFQVDGKGLAVAVLDTGLNTAHVDFAGEGRVPARVNFTHEDDGNPNAVADVNGHGSNVAGLVAAHGRHTGVAPGANVVPLKVLDNDGGGGFGAVESALSWVLEHRDSPKIGVVLLPIGDGGNYADDAGLNKSFERVADLIKQLRHAGVATVAPAGNSWSRYNQGRGMAASQGMAFPGICRASISAGAVFGHAESKAAAYAQGGRARTVRLDQITPYSQRLHESFGKGCRTTLFAPGSGLASSGHDGPESESVMNGTDQAAALTAGAVLLLQQFALRQGGRMPRVDELETWLHDGGREFVDGDSGNDNVRHTGRTFRLLDVGQSLTLASQSLKR